MKKPCGLLVVVALMAACGGAGQGGDTPDPSQSSGNETLAEFFDWAEDRAGAEALWRDEEALRQELIRSCMAEQGFEYIPVSQSSGSFTVGDEEEYIRTLGFGITTSFGRESEFFEDAGAFEDPNWEMMETLSETEREAYQAALWGSPEDPESETTIEIDPETGEELTVIEGFGCEGQASEQVRSSMDVSTELWDRFEPQLDAMWQRIQADPRMVELDDEWSRCMAAAEFQLGSRQELSWTSDGVFTDLHQRYNELVGDYWAIDPFEGWTEADWEERTPEEIEAIMEDAQEAVRANLDQEALTALQQEEIDLAVADFECAQDVGLVDAYQEIAGEYEAEFIAANRSVLEQIRQGKDG